MAINYSLVKLASKFGDKAGVPKFYARAQMNESISLKKFAKLISMQTTVSYADVTAVLVSMQENMIIELQRGNQIDFGELGKFRLQLAKTLDIEEAKKKPAKDNASSGGDTTGGNTSGEQTGGTGSAGNGDTGDGLE